MAKDEGENFIFEGFQSPNFTQVPDDFFDFLLPRLSGAEVKVLLYIMRRTFGWKKDSDDISFSQICEGITKRGGEVLDSGTGLSKSTAQKAIKGLTDKKVILAIKRQSLERGNEPTTYALNFMATHQSKSNHPYTENRHRGIPEIGIALYRKSVTQETVVQDIKNNVNVELVKNEENGDGNDDETAGLEVNRQLYEIVDYTGDDTAKGKGSFRKVINGIGVRGAAKALTITKDAVRSGTTTRGRSASYFIGVASNMAEEVGIDLGFKHGAQKQKVTVANLEAQRSKVGNRGAVRDYKSGQDDPE
jgi:phage replication O-like protein O